MISPTRHPPCLASGGTLARAHSTRAGLFPYPSRTSHGALCSVLLDRDARSARARGSASVAANRADCTETRRGHQARPRRHSSLRFRETAHQLRRHHTDAHQPSRLGLGAAGLVLRNALPRPSILGQVNNELQIAQSKGVDVQDLADHVQRLADQLADCLEDGRRGDA